MENLELVYSTNSHEHKISINGYCECNDCIGANLEDMYHDNGLDFHHNDEYDLLLEEGGNLNGKLNKRRIS